MDFLLKKYFGGKKAESLSPNQLEFLFNELQKTILPEKDDPPTEKKSSNSEKTKKESRKIKSLPEDLRVEEIILDPKELKENPSDYRCIGEERTEDIEWNKYSSTVMGLNYLERR